MNITWNPSDKPTLPKVGLIGFLRALMRGSILILVLLVGVVTTAILRVVEAPLFGQNRPLTPYITQWVCRLAFAVLSIRHIAEGERMNHPGAVVANHSSWLDIFALNARKRIYFVSKAEVANWPGIGLLARITGTVFIARDPKKAKAQTELFKERLLSGHKLLFFPEGTSTDGMRVLPFKTTLFQAFLTPELRHKMYIQPVTVIYQAPASGDSRFYGWWGDMDLGPHLLRVLAAGRQGSVRVIYHDAVKVNDFPDRKALAAHVEAVVRSAMPSERQLT